MTETLKKIEIMLDEHTGVELAECPGKKEIRLRVSAPGEWAVVRLTREQLEQLVECRYLLEVRG